MFKLHDLLEKNIARYPLAYRHYECYENYAVLFPNATLKDYHERSKSSIVAFILFSEQGMWVSWMAWDVQVRLCWDA